MYEDRSQPLISQREFVRRLGLNGIYGLVVIVVSLVFGMAGYHWLARQSWVDAFLNTSMLLGGMGPVGDLPNDSAKIFAGMFALYAGLVFLVVAILLLTPVFHRVLHHFHWEISATRKE
jgi:uncharacterized membrane protein